MAQALAPLLKLPLFDKDTILEQLFETKGTGDARWRRQLSRESDRLLQSAVSSSGGAVVTSFWHVPGMPAESGTSTEWLTTLSRTLVNVHCECPAELAASRFTQRNRHPGHLDSTRSVAEVFASIQGLPAMAYLDVGERVVIDTTTTIDRTLLVQIVEAAFARC